MFERFTYQARQVIVQAQEEARLLSHNYIGTEHILLGLLREGDGVAARVLVSLGVSLADARGHVEEIIGRGQRAPSGHIPFTPRAKKALELSLREAVRLGHPYIGTEHILLGLLREGSGVAAQVLVRLGADLNKVRQTVIDAAGTGAAGTGAAGTGAAGTGAAGAVAAGTGPTEDIETMSRRKIDPAARLTTVEARLAALERWAGARADVTEPDRPADLRDRAPVAEELSRLSAELERLRSVLRKHGLDTGDGAA
jgi:ATP-dependent Clp protease ATP-binding subunit ClpC